jgi:hypothetical protein
MKVGRRIEEIRMEIEKIWDGEGMKMELAGVSSRKDKVLVLSVCTREADLKPVEGLPLRAVSPVLVPKK